MNYWLQVPTLLFVVANPEDVSRIDAEIEKERLRLAQSEEVTDLEYTVQAGDFVEVDLDVLENPASVTLNKRTLLKPWPGHVR